MNSVIKIKNAIIKLTLGFAQIVIIAMAALIIVEITARWLFNTSTNISTDFVGYGMGIVFYWAAAKAIDDDVFVRMDILYDMFRGWAKKFVILASDVLLLFFNGTITFYFYKMLSNTFARGLRATNIYSTPLWIPRLTLFIGIAVFNLYLVCRIIQDAAEPAPKYSSKELRAMNDAENEASVDTADKGGK